ncbi:MAG: hypothetical protein PHV97_01245 [Candidatus Omnitrophica bacterium]|jgi:hypothetical protein|nr:hypothetical protein [Candidatus Omnitrophota bacterium]
MSSEELEYRLEKITDKKLATEVRRFLLNLFLLFDDNPPPHIQTYISEIMDILESQKVPEPVRLSLFSFF